MSCKCPLEEYIKACHDIGPPTYHANLIASAIQGGLKGTNTKCFNCGKYKHMHYTSPTSGS